LWDSQGILFIDFLTKQQNLNKDYLKLLKDQVKPVFCAK
jgi:hypothetical protein